MRRARMRWVQVWSVECGVWRVAVRRVKKVFPWRCIAPGSRAGPVLGQQHSSLGKNTHARASLAHGASKFYRWERPYSITLRQLPPRLVPVLLVSGSTTSQYFTLIEVLSRLMSSSHVFQPNSSFAQWLKLTVRPVPPGIVEKYQLKLPIYPGISQVAGPGLMG